MKNEVGFSTGAGGWRARGNAGFRLDRHGARKMPKTGLSIDTPRLTETLDRRAEGTDLAKHCCFATLE